MQFKLVSVFLLFVVLLPVSVPAWGSQELEVGTVISGNKTGVQGDYHVEYWKDGGSGTMTLKEGCDFSCEWGQVNNILFRKGVRPGTREELIAYEADYNPQGNSYLSIYGWFRNPLVEYYIIESWGSWKPPGGRSKGTFNTDSGTYDIFQNSRTGPSIDGNTTFQQYWSVRTQKRTSGIITCKNHFDAWEAKGMNIGSFYEVSFNVEAYQSPGGKADVQVIITTDPNELIPSGTVYNKSGTVLTPLNSSAPLLLYNALGQKIGLSGSEYFTGQRSLLFNTSKRASGVYFMPVKTGNR